MFSRRFTWVWAALLALSLCQGVPAQTPAPGAGSPAVAISAAPASAAPASAAPAPAPASVAPAVAASAAPAAPIATGNDITPTETITLGPSGQPMPNVQMHEIQEPSRAAHILSTILLILYFILSLALIICVMYTTTKNEGLTGIIGGAGPTTTAFKGKKSAEETLSGWTTRLSWAFLFASICLWFITSR